MNATTKQRRSVRRFVLLLIAGGALLLLDAWAQESGVVNNLTEDVLQLVIWSILLLPLVVSLAPHIESRATRRTIYATYIFAIVWRVIDVSNELPQFDSIPVLGNDSKYHEIGKEIMALVVRGSVLLVLVLLFVEMTRNITRLRKQTSHLQKLFENMPAVCFSFDRSGRILSWNRAAQRVYGYTPEEALGAAPLSIIVTPESSDATKQLIADVFAGKSVLDTEWRDRNKDGEIGYRLGSAFPLFRDNGSVECGVNINVDITDRKKAEAAAENERNLLRRLLDLQERERQTVSYDVHDGIVQFVVGAQMQVDACETTLDPNDRATAQKLGQASKHLRDAMREGRRLISGLRPPIIDESGLVAAIDHLIGDVSKDDGPRVTFEHNDVDRDLPSFLESAIYRIVQEALANVRSHSGASEALVRLSQSDGTMRLEIRDWGKGFQRINVPSDHFGLQGIEERARLLGGTAHVESRVGSGTRIYVELPVLVDDHPPALGSPKATVSGGSSV